MRIVDFETVSPDEFVNKPIEAYSFEAINQDYVLEGCAALYPEQGWVFQTFSYAVGEYDSFELKDLDGPASAKDMKDYVEGHLEESIEQAANWDSDARDVDETDKGIVF